MAQEQQKHLGERRMPRWLALLLVLLIGGGACWAILRLTSGAKPTVEAVAVNQPGREIRDRGNRPAGMASDQRQRGAGPSTNPARRDMGRVFDQARRTMGAMSKQSKPENARVFKRPDGGIRVLSSSYILFVEPKDKGGEIHLEYVDAENWLTRQQAMVLRIAEGAQREQGATGGVQLTDEQIKQVKVVTADPKIPLGDLDRAKLDGLASAWEAAADAQKPAAEVALLAGLREVAKKNAETARQGYVANIDKLAAMLTPQQMDQYRQIQNGPRRGRNG